MHFAAKQGGYIALRAGLGFRGLHIVTNARKFLKICVNISRCLTARNAQLIGKAESGNAVNNAEINGLGATADIRRHIIKRHGEHFRSCHGMNIEPVGKGLAQAVNLRHMRQDTQLNLTVIRAHELVAGRGDERRANATSVFSAHRNILQIRV